MSGFGRQFRVRQEAENAVSWSKYAPEGTRSNGGIFAPYSFGIIDRKEYTREANAEILVVIQIESVEALQQARKAAELGIPHEMLLLDLYAALRPIDAITGATTADDILNRIFSTFCIGK